MTDNADNSAKKKRKTERTGAKDRPWEPRVWSGMTFSHWIRFLVRNRFAVSPTRIPMVLILTGISLFNSCMSFLQWIFLGRKIEQTQIKEDPIFILGHWRTGTTWLHELLVLDPRFSFPTTYQCFAPNHFLFSAPFVTWWLKILLPRRRPMDNMRIGFDLPQEDELAFFNMGIPSPYMTWGFSNRPPQCQEYLDLRKVPPAELTRWKRAFRWFLKCITVKNPGKRIIVKSPTHTCRTPVLLEMFPNARFVYIVRDPFVVYPSMINTWKRLYRYHGAQVPKYKGLDEFVLHNFNHVFEVFEEDRKLIDPDRLYEVRYEDLVKDPMGQMQAIYKKLDLGDFDSVRAPLQEYIDGMSDYKTNRYELPEETRKIVAERFAPFIEQYGYEPKES